MMSAALFVLAVARVPALRRHGGDTVFMAGLFAGMSALLGNVPVYFFVDGVLGGINLGKLAMNSFMVVGLWYLRTAVVHAVSPDAGARSAWGRRLPLIITLSLQGVFFALTGPTSSTTTWGTDYHHLLPAALFSLMMIAFIAWSCGEIAWACFQFVPQMRRSFQLGFAMVGLGCIISVIVMAALAADALSSAFPRLSAISGSDIPFHMLEMLAILLVGVGLTIPAVAGRATRRKANANRHLTLARVRPIRTRVLQSANMERLLQVDSAASPDEQLHRMLVEIWDAELAAGPGNTALTNEERDYLLSVESSLDTEAVRR
ncbi:MAG TPA: hypothetical protein VF885_16510 [Arthrobacter sp.]